METVAIAMLWIARIMGVLYAIGGIFVINQARSMLHLEQMNAQLNILLKDMGEDATQTPTDHGRWWWLFAGGIITFVSGIALAAASNWALVGMSLLVIHQMLYVLRQNARVRRAQSVSEQNDAKVARSTLNAAATSVLVFGVTLWLSLAGQLR